MENRGDMGPVHGLQGRYESCSWQTGEVWDLVKGVEQGKKGSCDLSEDDVF